MSGYEKCGVQLEILWNDIWPLLLRLERYGEVGAPDRIEVGNIKARLQKELFDGTVPERLGEGYLPPSAKVVDMVGKGRPSNAFKALLRGEPMEGDAESSPAVDASERFSEEKVFEAFSTNKNAARIYTCGHNYVGGELVCPTCKARVAEAITFDLPPKNDIGTIRISMDDEMRDAIERQRSEQEERIWLSILRDSLARGGNVVSALRDAKEALLDWRAVPPAGPKSPKTGPAA